MFFALRHERSVVRHYVSAAMMVTLAFLVGCESTATDEADGGDNGSAVAVEMPLDPNAYPVPEGDALALIQFMSEIVSQPPKGDTDDERTKDVGRQMDARILAAERLEEVATSNDQKVVARRTKLESLRVLTMIGRDGGGDRFSEFAASLLEDPMPEVAMVGRIGQYQSQLDSFLTQSSDDASPIVGALAKLVDNEGTARPVFDAASETAMALRQVGLSDASGEVFELIGTKFAGHENEDIAAAAEDAMSQSHLTQVGAAFGQIMQGEEGGKDRLVEAATKALSGDEVQSFALMPMLDITQKLEYSGNTDVAEKLYALLESAVPKAVDPQLQKQATSMVAGGLKRMGLVGAPFEITGQTAAGEEFSWSDYEGKVVLVDFWATWCGPCLAEVPNVKENFDRYHDFGFEVVGVNLDEDRDRATQFLESNELAWVTVVSDDEEAMGFGDVNAKRYDVEGIPFLVLVGRDGNVDSLHLRGDLLDSRLAELFPDAVGSEAAEVVEADPTKDATQDVAEADGEVEMDVSESDLNEDESETEEGPALEETETLPPTEPPQQQVQLDVNPYLAAESLSASELMLYLLELTDKPKSVQKRNGFREAVVGASDRLLAESKNDKHRKIAAQKKLDYLHRDARLGDDEAQSQLITFVDQVERDMSEALSDEVAFFRLEQTALDQQDSEKELSDTSLIEECCDYLASQGEALDKRHLRLASTTVDLVNQIDSKQREPFFEQLAAALSVSKVRDVSRYGKRLKKSEDEGASDVVGRDFELVGFTTDGNAFDIKHLRQDIVVVDFWATWCGPCRKALPKIVQLADKHEQLRIVGVSLDADETALAEYLESVDTMPGITLFGKEAQDAAKAYQVRGIPTFFVLDGTGKITFSTNDADALDKQVAKLIEASKSPS